MCPLLTPRCPPYHYDAMLCSDYAGNCSVARKAIRHCTAGWFYNVLKEREIKRGGRRESRNENEGESESERGGSQVKLVT